MTSTLTNQERLERTAALLAALAAAKQIHVRGSDQRPSDFRRQLLHDPAVSGIVNEIVLVNEPWIRRCIQSTRHRLGIRDSADELLSKVLTGGYANGNEVGGVLAAILNYDTERGHSETFPSYLCTAINREFSFTEREKRQRRALGSKTSSLDHFREDVGDHSKAWTDRASPDPSRKVINENLVEVVRDAARHLPANRRPVAEMMIDRMLEEGSWPTHEEVGKLLGVTRERGRQVGNDTVERLCAAILENYPQLAANEDLHGMMAPRAGRKR